MTLPRLIATLFGIGYLRPARGTWGWAVGVALGVFLHGLGSFPLLLAATLAVIPLGFWATARSVAGQSEKDPSEIVIDEVAGQWIALLFPSAGFWMRGLDSWNFPWPGYVAAFLFFRLFDIWKPWPIRWLDQRVKGGLGIMLDDLAAGALSGIVLWASALAIG
jgi:phosphatidylglycerophosphatase A